jgi:hypothetical protein
MCDQTWCVNPDHLVAGTQQENIDDMRAKGRDGYGKNRGMGNGMVWLSDDNVRQIRRLLAEGQHTQREIGEMFGVGRVAISNIKNGRRWAWLE